MIKKNLYPIIFLFYCLLASVGYFTSSSLTGAQNIYPDSHGGSSQPDFKNDKQADNQNTLRISGHVYVVDGDTIYVKPDKNDKGARRKKFKIRLYGVDAPEMDTPQGVASRQALMNILSKSHFWTSCHVITRDTYGRYVAICYLLTTANQPNNNNINLIILRAGYAFAYRRFLTPDNYRDYLDAEQQAQNKRVGFWADDIFVRNYRLKKNF